MKCQRVQALPTMSEFMNEILAASFPQVCEKASVSAYAGACAEVAFSPEEETLFQGLSDQLCQDYNTVFRKKISFDTNGVWYSAFQTPDGIMRTWLKGKKATITNTKYMEIALFFAMLLGRDPQRREWVLLQILDWLGVSKIEGAEREVLLKQDGASDLHMLGLALLVLARLIGNYPDKKDAGEVQLAAFHQYLEDVVCPAKAITQLCQQVESTMVTQNRMFHPRLIQQSVVSRPEDVFVPPAFESVDSPFAQGGRRTHTLVVGKTGLGKSTYLQLLTLCACQQLCQEEGRQAIAELAKTLCVPQGLFVISVPASMFSHCFSKETYRGWTQDFVTLFFNALVRLSHRRNFYAKIELEDSDTTQVPPQWDGDMLESYLHALAKAGKLLLLLDSFDEVPAGDMRNGYLKALRRFQDTYCHYDQPGEIGAHVLVASRQMSALTMDDLVRAGNLNIVSLLPLTKDAQSQLVRKYLNLQIQSQDSDAFLEKLSQNHFMDEYVVNPYMLAVLCALSGEALGNITQKFIGALVKKMQDAFTSSAQWHNQTVETAVLDVLQDVLRVLRDIAVATLVEGKPLITNTLLSESIKEHDALRFLSSDEKKQATEKLREIFVTAVGLIVPADGQDEQYQFINNGVRFELAAQRMKENDEFSLLEKMSVSDYVGVLVPFLCRFGKEDCNVTAQLVVDLALHPFQTSEEGVLLRRAMEDLLLGRYGDNVSTIAVPGRRERPYVEKAQRSLLLRLLNAPGGEKKWLYTLPAYQGNGDWLTQ